MHNLIIKKFMQEMSDLQAAKQVRYQAIIADHCYEVAVYPGIDGKLPTALLSLAWSDDTVTLWVPDGKIFKKAFFIGPITYEEWQNLACCIKIQLNFETENLDFSGFVTLPIKILEDKTNGWHREMMWCTDYDELGLIVSVLKNQGLRNSTAPSPVQFHDRRAYYHINFNKQTVEYWVHKR